MIQKISCRPPKNTLKTHLKSGRNKRMKIIRMKITLLLLFIIQLAGFAGTGDTTWMTKGKYGIFIHYQYRILLGYCQVNSKLTGHPDESYPPASAMTPQEWNRFVDGFDVKGF